MIAPKFETVLNPEWLRMSEMEEGDLFNDAIIC
jgi:hypothetical protein